MAKLMQVISEPSSNKHLIEPFKIGEKVIYLGELERNDKHPETFFTQFVRIKRLKSKRVMTESREHFKMLGKKKK